MKKIKTSAILLLVLIMVLSVFSACGNTNNTGNTPNGNNNDNTDNQNDNGDKNNGNQDNGDDTADEIKLPDITLENKIVKYLTWVSPENWNATELKIQDNFKEFYGGELEPILADIRDIETRLASLVMSGDSPDLVQFRNVDFPNVIIKDLVQPISDKIDFSSPLWIDIKDTNDAYLWNGEYYGAFMGTGPRAVTWYNKKMFEENGLETPLDFYNRDEWNWDTMLQLAKELTYDLDRDGNIDVYGVTMHWVDPLLFATGKTIINIENDGTITNNLRDPDIAAAMKFYQDLTITKHNVMPQTAGDAVREFADGKVAMLLDSDGWGALTLKEALGKGEISYVPTPKYPGSDEWYVYAQANGFYFAKGAPNLDGAIAYVSVRRMYSADESNKEANKELMRQYGYTDIEFDMSKEAADKKMVLPFVEGIGKANAIKFTMCEFQTRTMGTPWETLVEENYPKLQSQIDKIMEEMNQ